MPKYYPFQIANHYLYFTAECIVEAMHVHASDKKMNESHAAKFFVKGNGDTVMQKQGDLTEKEVSKIRRFIKENYQDMYKTWRSFGGGEFYQG